MASKRKSETKTGVTPENKGPRLGTMQPQAQTSDTQTKVTADTIAHSFAQKAKIDEKPESIRSGCSTSTNGSKTNAFKGKETGNERDQIIVDVLKINGKLFKDQLTEREQNLVAMKLGIPIGNLSGIAPGYTNGHPTYTYRLFSTMEVTKINFHDIMLKRSEINEKGEKIKSEVLCKARGDPYRRQNAEEPETGPIYRWARIEDSRYKLEEEQIREWFEQFGSLETENVRAKDKDQLQRDQQNLYKLLWRRSSEKRLRKP